MEQITCDCATQDDDDIVCTALSWHTGSMFPYFCTRTDQHHGKHIACTEHIHCIHVWE